MTILQSFNLMYPNSDNNGETVNLARMMLSEQDTTNYNVYDNCREGLQIRAKEDNNKADEVDVYPNPTQGNLTVILPINWESGTIEIYDLRGSLIEKYTEVSDKRFELNLKLKEGTYLMKLNTSDGELYVKKFVIIK